MELNKIHNMDCLKGMKEMPDKYVDLIVTDPPYNIGKAKWDKIDNYIEWNSTDKRNDGKLHPTQKPTDIIERIIKTSSNENANVLDCFMGSGTTAIACINTNRNYIGFELDKGYFDIANKRIQDAKG